MLNKKAKLRKVFGVLVVVGLSISGCNDPTGAGPATSIEVRGPATLRQGESVMLTLEARDEAGSVAAVDGPVYWTSSDSSVLRVSSDGQVTAIAIGSASVTATHKNLADSHTIETEFAWAGITTSVTWAHTCGWSFDGILYCWGSNQRGQLGISGQAPPSKPARIAGDHRFTHAAAGGDFTCGVTIEGQVLCWGANEFGQLGAGTEMDRPTPEPITANRRFTSVTAGSNHACALSEEGDAYCWGNDSWGQLGRGFGGASSDYTTVPAPVAGGLKFRSISAGVAHTCGLTTTGAAYCWGWNVYGQAGIGSTDPMAIVTPTPVAGTDRFKAIEGGYIHTCALRENGSAACWGSSYLGNGTTESSAAPVSVNGGRRYDKLAASYEHSCALLADGEAYCWGNNANGRNGNGITDFSRATEPARVITTLKFKFIAAGSMYTCGITTEGDAYCWGSNQAGALGNGTPQNAYTPVRVLNPE